MKHYDLVVVGGGLAGVAASVSAAREGLSVLLLEQTGSLGGSMSNSLVYPYMKFTLPHSQRVLSAGIFSEMRQRHEAYGDTSWEPYKFVFDDMVTEAGVDVIFHAQVFDVGTDGKKIKSVFKWRVEMQSA